MRASFLTIVLLGSAAACLHAAKEGIAGWETLEKCQLVDSPLNVGDRVLVQHEGENMLFRIYWVDAPEPSDQQAMQVGEQAQYFSVTEETLTQAGARAKRFTQKFLRGEFTVHTKWQDARTGQERQFFAVIEKDGALLSEQLVAEGMARIYGMPSDEAWPNGPTPTSYLKYLKQMERRAQREGHGIWGPASASLQMSGLESLLASSESDDSATFESVSTGPGEQAPQKRINLNTASLEMLETLPGIGPALGQRIIAARPIEEVDALVEISGISVNTLAAFRHMVVTEDPPPPEKTVAFYLADPERYLNKEVLVTVERVKPLDIDTPENFRAVEMMTAHGGESGGSITAYIPTEFYESFIKFYASPGKTFTGLLYQQETEIVLVYRRH